MQALPRVLALSLLLALATATLPGGSAGLGVSADGSGGAEVPALAADCPRDCRQEYDDCIAAGGDVQVCEEVFKACFRFCNLWRAITNGAAAPAEASATHGTLPATVDIGDCEEGCRDFLLECSNACGTDQKCVDKCETAANACMLACRAIQPAEASASGEVLPAPACLRLLTGGVDATL